VKGGRASTRHCELEPVGYCQFLVL
jgi:hypothetical protein